MTATAAMRGRNTAPASVSPARLAIAGCGALGANLLVFGVGTAAGATWEIAAPEPVNALMVVVSTLLPFLLAGALTWLVARRFPVAPRWFAWAGLVVGVVSAPVGFLASSDVTTGASLAAMHLVAGVSWFLAVLPRAGAR